MLVQDASWTRKLAPIDRNCRRFICWKPEEITEVIPEEHPSHFVRNLVVEQLDLSAIFTHVPDPGQKWADLLSDVIHELMEAEYPWFRKEIRSVFQPCFPWFLFLGEQVPEVGQHVVG